jgi:3-phenylpropionate/trans-cinnamate dioxygenase ferredoxin subunit
MSEPAFVEVARFDDVPDGGLLGVEVPGGTRVCLVRRGHELRALSDVCTHQAFPMSAGELLPDGSIQCTWHGARFDCATGDVLAAPATEPLPVYEVRVDDEGRVLIGPQKR